MSKSNWMDPEIIAAGEGIGGPAEPKPKQTELEQITLDHWRVKEWKENLIAAGRNQFNELVIINDATEPDDNEPRFMCVRFFYLNNEVQASCDIKHGPAFEVFNYIMKLGSFEPLKRGAS